MKRKVGRPRGSGPAQLIRAVLAEEFYLAVKELEQRGTPLSELLVGLNPLVWFSATMRPTTPGVVFKLEPQKRPLHTKLCQTRC